MNLIFFDESKNDDRYPHYHIGGVCVAETDLQAIEGRINGIAERSFGRANLERGTEFHAAEIFHRKKHFKGWDEFDRRISLIGEFIHILSLPEVRLIDIQINVEKLWSGQRAEEVAFMFFCERSNGLCRGSGSVGMLIGDRESDRVSERHATTLSQYRASGTDFAFGSQIDFLVDSVHFTHSHLSRFLQLADVYTWLLQFMNRNRESGNFRHQAVFELLKEDGVNLFPSTYKTWPK